MAKTSLGSGKHRQNKKLGFIHHTVPATPMETDTMFKPHSGRENGKDFGNPSVKVSCPGFSPHNCNMSQGLHSLGLHMPNTTASKGLHGAWKFSSY